MDLPVSFMKLPDSLKYKDGKYEITSENGVVQKVEPATTKSGNHEFIIKGSGLGTWGIEKEALFPERKDIGGTAIAIAVLDKDHKLVGMALGRGDTGRANIIGESNGSVTIGKVLLTDGATVELPKDSRIEVEIERFGGKTKVKQEDAERLSKVVSDLAGEHKSDMDRAKEAADKKASTKLSVEHNPSVSTPHTGGGKKPHTSEKQRH